MHNHQYYLTIFIGLFARGNSHVIRLAVPLHFLFKAFQNEDDYKIQDNAVANDPTTSAPDENDVPELTTEDSPSASDSENPLPDEDERDDCTTIERHAIEAAQSIVKTCLHHVCK